MLFCTAINCMDGRVQLPVIEYLKRRFDATYVDMITEAGPVRHLAEEPDSDVTRSIRFRIDVSVQKHKSSGIAMVAHHDCAGNPLEKARQLEQLKAALAFLKQHYATAEIIGLWVDETWMVSEV